ncbi:hypothetical protein [Aquimarina sp. AD10]|uniref:hypothetical protein n=1 Tax=Aquimarina sp. AD10 TaxID=1714849 RepID=UPI0011C3EF8C|nr:hypothetical protein [Aquimarina sp. AD10]
MKSCILIIISVFVVCSCAKDTILFEDNFEGHTLGNIPNKPWKKSGAGIVVIDTLKSFSGNKSVHFISGEGYKNRAFIGLDHIFPIVKNCYFGTMKMYVEEASPNGVHWTMLQSSGKVRSQNFSAEIRYGGQHQKHLMANYDTQGLKSDCWKHSQVKIPEKKWFTLKWMFDGDRNTMKLWLDGTIVEAITVKDYGEGCAFDEVNNKWIFPVFENVLMGWVDYQTGGGTRNVWIDDVVITTK